MWRRDRLLGGSLRGTPLGDPLRISSVRRHVDVRRRRLRDHRRQRGTEVLASFFGQRIERAADASQAIDDHEALAMDDRHVRVGLLADRHLEAIAHEAAHHLVRAGQEHPAGRVGAVGPTVVSQHVRPVEVGIDAEGHQLHVSQGGARVQFLLELRHPPSDHRARASAASEDEVGNPHASAQIGQAGVFGALVLEDERRQSGENTRCGRFRGGGVVWPGDRLSAPRAPRDEHDTRDDRSEPVQPSPCVHYLCPSVCLWTHARYDAVSSTINVPSVRSVCGSPHNSSPRRS